jgi:hypothetical protein
LEEHRARTRRSIRREFSLLTTALYGGGRQARSTTIAPNGWA